MVSVGGGCAGAAARTGAALGWWVTRCRRTSRANPAIWLGNGERRRSIGGCHGLCAGSGMTHQPSSSPFRALDLSLQAVRCLRPLLVSIERHDKNLSSQLRNAASSVCFNLAEGRRRAGKDRLHLWRIAAGSADESRTALLVAEAWGYVDAQRIEEVLRLLDQVLAICWVLTRR